MQTFGLKPNSDNFNSIKVRLEPSYQEVTKTYGYIFQFHKGAIRTGKRWELRLEYHGFQFHKGAIRTALFPF